MFVKFDNNLASQFWCSKLLKTLKPKLKYDSKQ